MEIEKFGELREDKDNSSSPWGSSEDQGQIH